MRSVPVVHVDFEIQALEKQNDLGLRDSRTGVWSLHSQEEKELKLWSFAVALYVVMLLLTDGSVEDRDRDIGGDRCPEPWV